MKREIYYSYLLRREKKLNNVTGQDWFETKSKAKKDRKDYADCFMCKPGPIVKITLEVVK